MTTFHTLGTVPVSLLKASLICAAKDDCRAYLNSVHIVPALGHITSCDGHRLLLAKVAFELPEGIVIAPFTIPRALVEQAIKLGKKNDLLVLSIQTDIESDRTIQFQLWGLVASGKEFGDKYPEYTRIIPTAPSGETTHFNPEYLVDAQNALRLIADSRAYVTVSHNGLSPAVVTLHGFTSALAVIMPMRDESPDLTPTLTSLGLIHTTAPVALAA